MIGAPSDYISASQEPDRIPAWKNASYPSRKKPSPETKRLFARFTGENTVSLVGGRHPWSAKPRKLWHKRRARGETKNIAKTRT
jgi:hypothetical protein